MRNRLQQCPYGAMQRAVIVRGHALGGARENQTPRSYVSRCGALGALQQQRHSAGSNDQVGRSAAAVGDLNQVSRLLRGADDQAIARSAGNAPRRQIQRLQSRGAAADDGLRPAPQASAPDPGPTLAVQLERSARFAKTAFTARITPSR